MLPNIRNIQFARFNLNSNKETLLNEIETAVQDAEQLTGYPRGIIEQTLRNFQSYSQDYLNFFDQRNNITEREEALRNVQRELFSLKPLIEQRRVSSHYRTQLAIADEVANSCLDQWKATVHPKFLIMFEKIFHINTFVYDRAPVLAIPLANWNDPWAWMALGHEMGHFYYKNTFEQEAFKSQIAEYIGSFLKTAANDAWKDQSKFWQNWLEETFADIFGVYILGPAYIRSMIVHLTPATLPKETGPEAPIHPLITNDQDHPLTILRPWLQSETLFQLYPNNKSPLHLETKKIRQEWIDFCSSLAPTAEGTLTDAWNDYWLQQSLGKSQVKDAIGLVPGIVKIILDKFKTAELDEIIVYTENDHQDVQKIVPYLGSEAEVPDEVKLSRGSLYLPAAWYSWQNTVDRQSNEIVRKNFYQLISPSEKSLKRSIKHSSFAKRLQSIESTIENENEEVKAALTATKLLEEDFSTQDYADYAPCPDNKKCSQGYKKHYHKKN